MPVGRVDLGVAHAAAVVEQGLDDLAAALGRKAPVGVVKLTSRNFAVARARARVRLFTCAGRGRSSRARG